jgi:hypothetical protein
MSFFERINPRTRDNLLISFYTVTFGFFAVICIAGIKVNLDNKSWVAVLPMIVLVIMWNFWKLVIRRDTQLFQRLGRLLDRLPWWIRYFLRR